MIPRIKNLKPEKDFHLLVSFDDGRTVLYDVNSDMQEIPSYRALMTNQGLFEKVKLDQSRTCVYWNEDIDLPSDSIYEYGKQI